MDDGTTLWRARGTGLLATDDPPPTSINNPRGSAPFLLTGDHAGDAIPAALGTLGLAGRDRARHIALDIGVRGLGLALAERLDACFVHQRYSRLVIDCNRDPARADAVPAESDGTAVPGNAGAATAPRAAAIHAPYHAAIAAAIARRRAAGRPTVLVALHSFTPVMAGEARPWHVGVLHDRGDARFALALLAALAAGSDLAIGDNQPYRMDATDFSVPHHAYPAALPYAEIEVRQDLIADAAGQARWADRLAAALVAAWRAYGAGDALPSHG